MGQLSSHLSLVGWPQLTFQLVSTQVVVCPVVLRHIPASRFLTNWAINKGNCRRLDPMKSKSDRKRADQPASRAAWPRGGGWAENCPRHPGCVCAGHTLCTQHIVHCSTLVYTAQNTLNALLCYNKASGAELLVPSC